MGICFILVIFGLSVSAKEEDLQGYLSMKNEITTFRTTVLSEDQNNSERYNEKASTERPAHLTIALLSSPETDLFHTPHERGNITTTADENAITQNDTSFVSTYGTDLPFLRKDSTAEKKLQSEGDILLISNDEGGIRPSAEAEFKSMMNDTMTPSAHLSRGREKISAFLHAPLKSVNQTVLDSITFSHMYGIPVVSASDPAVIDNLEESNESMESQGKNRSENWTLVLFRTERSQKPIQTDDGPVNKIHSTVMHVTVPQPTGLLTAVSAPDLKKYPKKGFEGELKEPKDLYSQNSGMLNTPLQVKPASQVLVNLMTESNRNPTTNEPKPILGVHPDSMFLFSTSRVTPTKTPDSTLNYFPNMLTAAGEMHVTKQFAALRLISDSLPKIAPARDSLESKLISQTESSKKHHIKQTSFFQTLTTSFFHRLNASDVPPHTDIFTTAQDSSSSGRPLLQTPSLSTKASIEARTCNSSAIEILNGTDHSSVLLSKLMAVTKSSFTSAEEASTTGDKRILMKHPQRSFTAPPALLTQAQTSKLPDQFEKLSTRFPPTKPPNTFHVSEENNHSPVRQSRTHLPSETLRLFASDPPDRRPARATREPSKRTWTQSSFTPDNVRRFRNNLNFTEFSYNVSGEIASVISKRLNVTMIFTGRETVSATTPFVASLFTVRPVRPVPLTSPNSHVSRTSITFARTAETSITPLSLEPQVSVTDRLLSPHAVSRKKTSLISTPFSKSHNIVTTHDTILSKLSGISKNSNSENIFLNHSLTTENISSPFADRQQGPKKPKGTEMLFSTHYTVSTIPSVENHSEETSLTETQQLQSKVEIESYLKKIHRTVKPKTLQHIDQSDSSVVNHTSPKSILRKIVSQNLIPINSSSVSPVVYSTAEIKHHSTFSALPETSASAEQVITPELNVKPITTAVSSGKDNRKDSFFSHQAFANSTDVQEHSLNVASSPTSGITESLNRPKMNTAATQIVSLNTSPSLESSAGTVSSTLPLFLSQMQTALENHTKFLARVYRRSQMAQPSLPSYEVSNSATTENPKRLAQSADIHYIDVGSSNTQTFTKGSLQPSGGSGATHAKSDSLEGTTEFVSDVPVINRRKRIISPDSLSGFAQISDDICGTGNYTAEMSLNLERDIMPGDLIPALGNLRVVINLKTNNSHVDIEIKSCCLSPNVRLDEFNTTCCIFSRLPVDPHGTRPLPSIPSKRAPFTIRLFQMINYSTAYLHCDLSVCLRNHSECERQCVECWNVRHVERAGAIFRSAANRISFSPVLKGIDNSSLSEAAADMEAAVVIMGSVAGCLLACLALLLVWMAHRRCLERSACCWSGALCEC
ncbi:hypothetical protein IRJ41_004622 [Triplophysa rosa]|uniref:ZP domain-containing protein n=1 Tax=Triplophysa rosa TaxID=992332 RepID=A0A9W7TQU5_TRIRA|nr:hypothetical protein IRJ41_004622 [Triplophysa rosa]